MLIQKMPCQHIWLEPMHQLLTIVDTHTLRFNVVGLFSIYSKISQITTNWCLKNAVIFENVICVILEYMYKGLIGAASSGFSTNFPI